jgi:hypothetical protein
MLTFLSFNHFERKIIKIVNLNLNKIKFFYEEEKSHETVPLKGLSHEN